MCVKFNLNESKQGLESLFHSKMDCNWESVAKALPFNQYPIFSQGKLQTMQWGNIENKEIHKRRTDISNINLKPGILPINGFFTWKKEKLIAPIGFGDHKETIKLHPLLICQKNVDVTFIPVLFEELDGDQIFYILVDKASDKIKHYQPNEPLTIIDYLSWLDSKSAELSKFSESSIIEIYE